MKNDWYSRDYGWVAPGGVLVPYEELFYDIWWRLCLWWHFEYVEAIENFDKTGWFVFTGELTPPDYLGG